MKSRQAILIENNTQTILEFRSVRKLKKWAKEHGFDIKRSWFSDFSDAEIYYTEGYVILPTA